MKIVQMECDGCGADVLGDRTEARDSHGWKRRKVAGEMRDLCPSCARNLGRDPKGPPKTAPGAPTSR